jgi:hypothetical protein
MEYNKDLFHWVPAALYLGLKWLVCEVDHSPSSSSEVKSQWNCTFTPKIHLHYMMLNKVMDVSLWFGT